MGAPRRHIIVQLLSESLILAVIGGFAGILVAYGGIRSLVALGPRQIPRLDEIGLDLEVLAFALGVSLIVGVLVGLAPAWQAAGADPADGLRHGSQRGGAAPGRRIRHALVLSELVVTLVLLVGAALLVRSFERLLDVDPGFRTERLLTFQLELPMGTTYPEQWQRAAFFEELLDRIRRHPQVRSVTMASAPPLGEGDFRTTFSVVGQADDGTGHSPATIQLVGPDYFRTLGIPFVAGRTFTEQDDGDAPRVAIVNQTAARRWPDGLAIGGRIVAAMRFLPEVEIVGIARDVRVGGLDGEVPPIAYLSSEQVGYNFMTVMVRTASAPSALLPAIREVVRDLDADQPIYNVRTIDELLSRSVAERRFQMLLLALFSGIALLLALGGVFGVMSYTVVQRTREIGVRMALGARPRDVSSDVVRESAALGLIAIAIGVPLAFLFSSLLRTSLFGIGPADPWSYTASVAMILSTVILSAFLPALRAASVDPRTALQVD